MSFSIKDLIYQGEKSGVHNWQTLEGMSYYWHPDWLHIAEDMTGHKATAAIDINGEKATQSEAEQAIVQHLNNRDK
ncbi:MULTISPECIES: hypothetical protein [Shewanella]|jgi:cell wall assembly regulator SMI1|uniref:Uncharacterized protein n=3 Tax=Shewanella putrefaciens TaxID=24 RepID=E6XPZ2_SHEP2|nr:MULTISPECIES: hypothetical protein [Shewanella]CAD6364379.1 hypothetical protein SHEWT2_02072 [Shewanella hafniensis]ABM23391.1 conserved hypothetical protein [Shewanella sp. W3-18-1]AVV85108.1 hypothetical protein SPWS13_3399 [Shewanella putrefaciens]MCA1898358.1 hypothetical protein [Shewanella putrefaciens]MCK7630581.1 hypothetical protein [Shewanella sp. JNE9-1]